MNATMQDAMTSEAALRALGMLNCPNDSYLPGRIAIVAKRLAVIDGEVRVVDADGNARTGAGGLHMTTIELIRELGGDTSSEFDALRWKRFGQPYE